MKIKDVIERTGLTDRAIRLYIDNGLFNPSIEESYSGRKSIDFSESDIVQLNNIAMLRKAGFSLADIKNIIDKTDIEEIIRRYIEETKSEINHKTEIVEKLKNISFDEEVTIETICGSLSATVEKNEIPYEDMHLTAKETVNKVLSVIYGVFLLVFSVGFLIMVCTVIFDFRYIRFDPSGFGVLCVHFCWLIMIVLSIIILCRSTGMRFIKNSRGKMKGLTATLIAISIIGCTLMTPFSFLLMIFGTPFYSQTTEIENYMKFDESLEKELNSDYSDCPIYEVFPRKIPLSAKITSYYPYNSEVPDTTKYYYKFTSCPDSNYGTYDIFAEWVLSDDEYERAKKDLPGDISLDNDLFIISQIATDENVKEYLFSQRKENNGYKIETKGDWTVIYYMNDEKMGSTYLIAAYNDTEKKMRYIASSCCGHEKFENGPYYLTLDW